MSIHLNRMCGSINVVWKAVEHWSSIVDTSRIESNDVEVLTKLSYVCSLSVMVHLGFNTLAVVVSVSGPAERIVLT